MRHEVRILGGRYRANKLRTMIELPAGDGSTYVVVAGNSADVLDAEARRVRRGRAMVAIPRAITALVGGALVLALLGLAEPVLVPLLERWLGPARFIGGALIVVPAVLIGAASTYGATRVWVERWTPGFDGIPLDPWAGRDLYKRLTPEDRDRLLATRDADELVRDAALRLLAEAYRAEDVRREAEEERATAAAPAKAEAEARRLMNLPSQAPTPTASRSGRKHRGLSFRQR